MIIIKELITNYINNITIDDLRILAKKYELKCSEDELNTVFDFIKNYYQDLLMKNDKVLILLKNKINDNLYSELNNIYQKAKDKYL